MTKIFKQLARHWAVCLVVFALLFVQAFCDLALPDYTSKIVDTGIQQGGIEGPLPRPTLTPKPSPPRQQIWIRYAASLPP